MISTDPSTAPPEQRKHSHYFKSVAHLTEIDIYRVCDLFVKNDPSGALAHAVKKILVAGGRGAKDIRKDIQEAIDTLTRKLQMLDEDVVDPPASSPEIFFSYDLGGPEGDRTAITAVRNGRVIGGFGMWNPRVDPMDPIAVKEQAGTQPPWLPPGYDWVLVPDDLKAMPPELHEKDSVRWLNRYESQQHGYTESAAPAGELNWSWKLNGKYRIVAYSIVRKYEAPWTPPGTDGWIEVPDSLMTIPDGLSAGDTVQILTRHEREKKHLIPGHDLARNYLWSIHHQDSERIVAYRIISQEF